MCSDKSKIDSYWAYETGRFAIKIVSVFQKVDVLLCFLVPCNKYLIYLNGIH